MTILGAPDAWLKSSPTRWYLVFCDAAHRRWWDRVFRTPAGFSHVYALRWDGFNWLMFNPSLDVTEVAILPAADQNALDSFLEPGSTVVEVQAFRPIGRVRGRWWIGPMTCVEQIKALLGLSIGRVWTPQQLYLYLTEGEDDRKSIQETENARADRAGKRGRTTLTRVIRRPAP